MADSDDAFERRVRARACWLWEQDGSPEGRDEEYWHRARELEESEQRDTASRAPAEFAGETGAAPLPEQSGTTRDQE
ncbi:MAG: DUF2934 domain-containing protein [Pseudomonadota bacterium]|nr:DUF2934 domain-containing protein [Pseudomonadota bacterium]